MRFVVTKPSLPELVVPSEPTPAGKLPLTSTDKSRLFVSFTSFHIFESPIHEPAATIRRALSKALVHYYPVAGRVAVGAGGDHDHHIACTGDGVAFVAATASCTLQDIKFLGAPPAIPPDDLALRYGGCCRTPDPLLMMQVTEFACGGYIVATTWNHGVADAFGLAQFLHAVGELARGLPSPSVAPVRCDESLPDIRQLRSAVRKRSPRPAVLHHMDMAYCDVTIPWSFINRVKAEFRDHAGGRPPCTSFEVVTAAVWRCQTRAINADPDAPAPLVFTANVRKHIGAKDGYYGNCVFSQLVEATGGAVAGGAIVDVVGLIKDAKQRIPEALTTCAGETAMDDKLIGALCGYGVLAVSTWGGIGLDGVDFGGGRPVRVLPNMERTVAPLCFPCLPFSRKSDHGANVIATCVTEEHVEEFLAEIGRLQ
ncbi:hypothetical protein ACP70R_009349 [Stipagrostis hirtigluma subsp. patula]